MGSTWLSSEYIESCKDHPHIHGEHPGVAVVHLLHKGSPPYTWGALDLSGGGL